jgi:excisionase family DNA binding protein
MARRARGHQSCAIRGMPASLMIDHAAAMLGVCRRTVYYRIREGRLRTVRTMGGTQRVLVESIIALMREREPPPPTPRAAAVSGTGLFAKFRAP